MPYVLVTFLHNILYKLSWIPHILLTLLFLLISVPYSYLVGTGPITLVRLAPSARARIRREKEQPTPLLQPPRWYQRRPWSRPHLRAVPLSFDPARNTQSPLLTLPAELRTHIFRAVLGELIIHLDSTPLGEERREPLVGQKIIPRKCVTHMRCSRVDGQYCRCFGWHTVHRADSSGDEDQVWGYDRRRARTERIGLALLLTCRQTHAEAIPILYGTNSFAVHNLWDLIDFSRAILPDQLAMVTSLDVKWLYYDFPFVPLDNTSFWALPEQKRPPYDDGTWVEFWELVATEMPGLQKLRASVDVRIYGDHLPLEGWMAPMLKVRGLRNCAVELRDRDAGGWGLSEGPWERAEEVRALEGRLEDHMCGRAEFTL
ncbi:hypothetical protein MMC16_005559 [Acarospora aff. strigata]|nr:hypothetical protein [Acarospora aff. strigata]